MHLSTSSVNKGACQGRGHAAITPYRSHPKWMQICWIFDEIFNSTASNPSKTRNAQKAATQLKYIQAGWGGGVGASATTRKTSMDDDKAALLFAAQSKKHFLVHTTHMQQTAPEEA